MMEKNRFTLASNLGLLVLYVILYAWQPGGERLLRLVTDVLVAFGAYCQATLSLSAFGFKAPVS
jgi:hypothetical protein